MSVSGQRQVSVRPIVLVLVVVIVLLLLVVVVGLPVRVETIEEDV